MSEKYGFDSDAERRESRGDTRQDFENLMPCLQEQNNGQETKKPDNALVEDVFCLLPEQHYIIFQTLAQLESVVEQDFRELQPVEILIKYFFELIG